MPEINDRLNERTGFEIAVIGMAGKFPGAKNIHEFWENLKNGVESIAFLIDEELKDAKVNPGLLEDPNYVKCKGGVLEDIEYFDAAFFDYIPSEAEVMDPQVRFLHEFTWTALEDAGYNPGDYTGSIGLYAGASANLDWEIRAVLSGKSQAVGKFTAQQLMDRDFLCSRAAYKLDLRGPAVTVQTACSTSLLAIYMGCRALISGECDIVLAGGVSISSLEKGGYFYEQGMILSRDGHCRAFDADASGTVGGAGVGIVVLKSLDEALADRDHIYAVIKGSAINNDGCGKIGYTAPGVEGQAEVIEAALDMAEIPSDSITYIESHGTGTALGDPIEIEALTQAFNTNKKGFCAVGAVKANIGHLDAAAGVAGFIKTVLTLKHQLIPPAVNFQAPNPKIDFENSPFYINTTLKEWKNDKYPLRAGVSSFGIGGTNAHVILEEVPVIGHSSLVIGKDREYQLILLSARTEGALQRMRVNLANHFKKNPHINLADAAYTLQKGRKSFEYRKMWVCENPVKAAQELMSENMQPMTAVVSKKDENRLIVFMFPGLGAQYENMGRELYQKEPIFQKEMDRCFEILNGLVDYDIKKILYPGNSVSRGGSPCPPSPGNSPLERGASKRRGVFSPDINQLDIAQVVVFSFEYALAKLVIKWGIKPDAMIGYSFGEYTAACLAGVLSLEDALKLIVSRGRLIDRVPAGSMLSVPLTAIELKPLLNKELSIAIDNGPSCVVAGPNEVIDAFETQMQKKRILCMRVQASRAIHSQMMEPICGEFRKIADKIKLNKPQIPYISNVTGDWLRAEQAVAPGYWATHLQKTVRFAHGIKKLLEKKTPVFIEIGPGRDLSNLMTRYLDSGSDQPVINLIRDPRKNVSDVYYMLNRLGSLWLHGVKIDWTAFHAGEERYRIPLPTYSFEAQRCWVEGVSINLDQLEEEIFSKSLPLRKKPNTADWFYIPSWKRSGPAANKELPTEGGHNYLVFIQDNCPLGEQLANRIRQKGGSVIIVKPGSEFAAEKSHMDYRIDPRENKHYEILFGDLRASGKMPDTIIHLWSLTQGNRGELNELNTERLQQGLTLGFYSLLYITQSIEKQRYTDELDIKIISTGLHEFSGDEEVYPEQSPVLALVKVIPQEYPNIRCQGIDILLPAPGSKNEHRVIRQLLTEFAKKSSDTVVAYRGNHRWARVFEPMPWEEPGPIPSLLKEEGVYLVTGGLGKIGLYAAEYLTKTLKAKLVLTRRSPFPAKEDQEKILKIRELEKAGTEILILSADAANYEQMKQVIDRTYERFGRLDGVIHCAGTTRDIRKSVQQTDKAFCEELFYPKIQGTLVLERILQELSQTDKYKAPGFCLLISSLAVVLGGLGMAAYTAAHFFIDSFVHAHYHHHDIYPLQNSHNRKIHSQWFCVDLEGWNPGEETDLGIRPDETIKFFDRLFSLEGVRQVVISTGDLRKRIERWVHLETLPGKADKDKKKAASLRTRPALLEAYEAPHTPLEQKLAELWQEFFGIDRIGIHDNFFELGGDSLKGMTLVNQYRKLLGEMVYVQVVFDAPTIAELAVFFTRHFPGAVASLTGSGPGDDGDALYPKEKITESFGYERLKETGGKYKYAPIELTEKKEYYTLSSAQRRLYILHQLQPESVGYNSPRAFLLGEEIDRERLEQAFRQLIRRHEILRTSFEIVNGEPVQRVHDEVDFKIEYYKLQITNKKETGSHHSPFITHHSFIRPFDIARTPLVRVGFEETGDSQMFLLLDNHHIVSDGMSHQVLIRDFAAFYRGKSLPSLRLQYKDFSSWQNHLFKSNEIKKQEGYWLNLFKDVDEIPKLDLPTDYPRPVVFSFEGDRYRFSLDEKPSVDFKNLGTGQGMTLYMNVLAVFNVLLYKYTSQEDIVIGCGIAGRQHADLEEAIGMFINTLAMRNRPRARNTYLEMQNEVKKNCIDAFENQDFPFEELVDKLEIERDPSRNPLFDAALAFQNFERTTGKINTDLMQPLQNQDKTSKFDITLYVIEMDSEIHFQLEYCTRLFKPETIERMAGHFLNLIRNIYENPNSRIGNIDILSEEEKQLLIYDYNRTEAEYPHDKTIHELFAGQAERMPDYTALQGCKDAGKDGAAHVTYHELDERSDRLAHLLIEKGVQLDTIVGIVMHRSMELVIGIMAILKAGGAYLPIDPQYPQERIDFMLKDSSARILLKGNAVEPGKSKTNPNDQNKVSTPIVLNFEHFNFEFVSNFEFRASNLSSSKLTYVIYTSGSTGKPKGVTIEQSALVNYIWGAAKNFVKGEHVNFPLYTSISFDLTVTSIFTPLITGNTIVIYDEEDRGQLIRQVVQNSRNSVIKVTPSHLKLIREMKIESHTCSIRRFIVGGEALESSLAADIYDIFNGAIEIYNEYGPTEAAVGCMLFKYNHGKELRGFVPIGKAAANYRIYLVDKQGNTVPVGIVGELLISGPGLARGYLNNPDLTAEKFCLRRPGGTLFEKTAPPGPRETSAKNFLLQKVPGKRFYMSYRSHRSYIYKTGDLARRLPDGNIEFLGRIDQQLKIKGFRIEPAEIKSRLLEKEEIKDVVVLAKEDDNKEKYLCAYIVSTKELNTPEPREWLSKTLPHYMVPLYMVQLESIPLTGSGKVDHKALPKPDVKIADKKYNPPGNWVEEKLVEIWQEVLAIEKIGVTTNFFEIGGDSIKAIQVSARLKNYQLDLKVNDLFLHPTIRELGKYVQSPAMPGHGIAAHEQGTVQGEVQLTPIQRWFFDHYFTDKHHFNHAIMLYSEKGFREAFVTKLFKKIIEHHDALRMVYKRKGTKVVQWNRGPEEPLVDLQVVDLKNRHAIVLENEIEKTAHRIQRSIDLEKGPLLKSGLFKTDQGDHLLIVIHHLVIDGVSWRILFEDISRGYSQLEKGEELVFQEKTTSFRCWSQKLVEYSQSHALLNQLKYWRSVEETGIEKLPKDFAVDAKAKKTGNSKVIHVYLEEEHTESLLKEVNQAYSTQINDILLTAIGMALREWKGIEKPVINLEGHGRENIIEGIDLSRTVGWFTAQFPVVLDMSRWQDLSYIIKSVKETLRKIPQKGIGYGILRYLTPREKTKGITFGNEPEISFNYLGQVDNIKISRMKTGDAVSPHLERVHTIEINGITTGGKLTVTFRYNKCEFMKSTIEKLAHAFHSYLIKIIKHCTGKKEKELTPADMDYSKELTIDQLEELEDKFKDLMVEGG